MKRRWILAFAVVAFARGAFAAPDDAPRVELPLGPFVRPGRPLDVRVVGGADRVRATGTPWALPQGERGDEFILQLGAATTGVLRLEIDRGGRVDEASLPVETLPEGGDVYGVRGDAKAPDGVRVVRLPSDGLPTVPEGWLVLDGWAGTPTPESLSIRGQFPRSAHGLFEPLLLPPVPRLFVATAESAERAPRLTGDVQLVLWLLALTEVALVAILALRRDGPWRRAAWLAAPAAAVCAFLAVGDRLPGALRAEATAISMTQWKRTLVLVRVEARRAGNATFELPPDASSAAVLRYSSDDATVETVSAGRRVEMEVPAGQSRLFAYVVPTRWTEHGPLDAPFASAGLEPIPPGLSDWIGDAGFTKYADGAAGWYHIPHEMLPRARGAVIVPGLQVLADGVPLTK